jgi:hypothetical protein
VRRALIDPSATRRDALSLGKTDLRTDLIFDA